MKNVIYVYIKWTRLTGKGILICTNYETKKTDNAPNKGLVKIEQLILQLIIKIIFAHHICHEHIEVIHKIEKHLINGHWVHTFMIICDYPFVFPRGDHNMNNSCYIPVWHIIISQLITSDANACHYFGPPHASLITV